MKHFFIQVLYGILTLFLAMSLLFCGETQTDTEPKGEEKTFRTHVLETGADLLQNMGPVRKINMYLVGFHPMKDNPSHSMEAHHFCRQVNQDFAQCVLFDGNSEEAKMNGIEYIISERLFETLPAAEKKYWHPHNHEILSGQLVMPGLPDIAEKAALADKMNSYGKTWHIWNTGGNGIHGDELPLGEPKLAWSYNADGEINQVMEKNLENRLGISLMQKREQRSDLVELARPQEGVDALKTFFPNRKKLPGVVDKNSANGLE